MTRYCQQRPAKLQKYRTMKHQSSGSVLKRSCGLLNLLSLSRLTGVAIFIWLLLLLYVSTVLVKVQYSQSSNGVDNYQYATREATALEALERIKQASRDIEALKLQNEELKMILYESSDQMAKSLGGRKAVARLKKLELSGGARMKGYGHLSAEHEIQRRQLQNGIRELWYFFGSELRKLSDLQGSELKSRLEQLVNDTREQHRTVAADAIKLGRIDGAERWRREKLANMSALVQRRLHWLQTPRNCTSRQRLLCNLNKGCGFGCQIHHAAYCFMVAYGTKRTMLLDTANWRYAKTKSWEDYLQPVTNNCDRITDADRERTVLWSGEHQTDPVITMPIVDALRNPPPYLPLAFPEDLSNDLLHSHGAPPVWWVAQFVKYLMRPSSSMAQVLSKAEQNTRLSGDNALPTVGVHVRRTDKVGAEAAFHSIDEYMKWVEEWFRTQDLAAGKALKRRVYLATDDTELLDQTIKRFPYYEVLGDQSIVASAQLNRRYTDNSLKGVLLDIHLLSLCDYLVCTFSSQVCRVAYELMQTHRGDAADAFHSLDDIYYFGGQQAHEQQAWLAHRPNTDKQRIELELNIGDTIGVAGNHWDGYSKGRLSRNGRSALYPSYKVREKWRIVKMPTYEEVV